MDHTLITVFNDQELATILHGLRLIQESANGPQDCTAGLCDHFDEAEPLTDAEIDALCDRLQLQPVAGVAIHERNNPPSAAVLAARAGILPHDPQDDEEEVD